MTKLTFETWDNATIQTIQSELKDYMDVLKWSFREYGDDLLYACSFGAEGVVLIDLISKVQPYAKVVFLDTDLHFDETYTLIKKMKEKYPRLQIDLVKPKLSLPEQSMSYGKDLWKHNPNLCCKLRKIEPLEEELSKVSAWISGLRREQSDTRRNTDFINKDTRFQKIKICPLIYWSWEDIWTYIRLNNLPYNELHDQNYPSIGCSKCTSPSTDGRSRSGRWTGSDKTECGLHQA